MSDQDPAQSEDQIDEVQYDPSSSKYDVYECVDCDNVVLVIGGGTIHAHPTLTKVVEAAFREVYT